MYIFIFILVLLDLFRHYCLYLFQVTLYIQIFLMYLLKYYKMFMGSHHNLDNYTFNRLLNLLINYFIRYRWLLCLVTMISQIFIYLINLITLHILNYSLNLVIIFLKFINHLVDFIIILNFCYFIKLIHLFLLDLTFIQLFDQQVHLYLNLIILDFNLSYFIRMGYFLFII